MDDYLVSAPIKLSAHRHATIVSQINSALKMIKYSLILIISALLAAGFACMDASKEPASVEEFFATLYPDSTHQPSPTSTAAVQGGARLATLVALTDSGRVPTPDPTRVRELWITATVAIATAQSAGATAKATGASADQAAEATASRAIANSAKSTAIAIGVPQPTQPPPDFMLTTIAESSKRETEKAMEAWHLRYRANRCKEANAIRANVATAESRYARSDVSLGELSVFAPKEATIRAGLLQRADELCR